MSRFNFGKEESVSKIGVTGTRVITDTATGVQYLFAYSGYAGGLTLLVDKDGKPLVDKNCEQK